MLALSIIPSKRLYIDPRLATTVNKNSYAEVGVAVLTGPFGTVRLKFCIH